MSNIDTAEIDKFNQMAQDWWDPNGPCKPLHLLNPVRLGFIQAQCPINQKPILDVGCGGGILTEALSQFSPHVVGIDQATELLTIAQQHAAQLATPPTYLEATAESHAATHAGKYAVITCMELLEHVPSPAGLLCALATLLQPGGDLFVSTINRTPKAFFEAILGAEYILRMLPVGTHDYKRFIRPSEIAEWVRPLGLHIQSIRGIQYHLLSQTFSLTQSVKVNYIMHLKKDSA